MAAKDKIIVALDVPSVDEAGRLVATLQGTVSWYKVGLQLFTLGGPRLVRELKETGAKIFLDLKFHDIPNTVRQAVESACVLGVDMLTFHLSGGSEMCAAAIAGRGRSATLLLGVTVLTSQTDATLAEVGVQGSVTHQVITLAALAKASGITGLVASPLELKPLREKFGRAFTIVTPGIRPTGSETGDQKRVMTPAEALQLGSDYLVIGRPITDAKDPKAAIARIVSELG